MRQTNSNNNNFTTTHIHPLYTNPLTITLHTQIISTHIGTIWIYPRCVVQLHLHPLPSSSTPRLHSLSFTFDNMSTIWLFGICHDRNCTCRLGALGRLCPRVHMFAVDVIYLEQHRVASIPCVDISTNFYYTTQPKPTW